MGLRTLGRATVARSVVRANGDESAILECPCLLVHGQRNAPAILVASERAVHIIEVDTEASAVCSYNRIVRFDRSDVAGTTIVGLSCYMGRTPMAERLASGDDLHPHELANYRVELAPDRAADRVLRMIATATAEMGVPPHAHSVQRFI